MRHMNVVIPDDCHDFVVKRKKEWKLKTLDDTMARIIYNNIQAEKLLSQAKIREAE